LHGLIDFLSGIVRSFEESQKAFLDGDGFSFLLRAMQSDVEKLQIKAVFLLCALIEEQPAYKGWLLPLFDIDNFFFSLQIFFTAWAWLIK
jgi:hypothetical protein